ncbi:Glutathione S-transferase 1 [Symbiodinium microadriaticum]|uniref:Glutathione S-transferase 1 n=1 Tax=Symbiodinium microadriaticum TaxID=2951 RepID=A0A1Q9EP42_SYMMI|nr:Glutathione S-transferase 1 [Symbiodinium microadriaticum]
MARTRALWHRGVATFLAVGGVLLAVQEGCFANSTAQPSLAGLGRLRRNSAVARPALKYTYFPLWAKGPAVALALQHSGLEWEGAFPDDWKTLKPKTPFLELPILETPSGTIGHELAILNYIGQQSQRMAGHDLTEFAVSQQLLSQAEDMYQKMVKLSLQLKTEQITGEEAAAFWTDEDEQTHNRNFGAKVYLKLLEAFYKSSGGTGGKFTSSGITVGECKLFSTLHAMKLAKDDILADYAELSGFYDRFAAEAATQAILKGEGKMPGTFNQYFKF